MTTLKQIKPILNKFKKQNRPILTNALVNDQGLLVHDFETYITFKDKFDLDHGLHPIEKIGLIDPITDQEMLDEYPISNTNLNDNKESFTINLKTIENLLPFVSKDETRLHLNGVAINDNHYVACDGHTLNYYELGKENLNDYIIPSNSLKILTMLLKKYKLKDDFTFHIDGYYFSVENEFFQFSSRLIQRDYVKWQIVIPKKFENEAVISNWVNFKELKPLLNKRTKSSRLEFKNGEITLIITGYENNKYVIGKCEEKIEKTIGFNMSYLERACLGSKAFEIKFNNELSPVKVNDAIIMPLRL